MVAEAAKLVELTPDDAARLLAQSADEEWLVQLQRSLDRELAHIDLDRILAVWNLSQAETAVLFNVSRQAVGKWLSRGVPADRVAAVSDLAAATDLLSRHLKRDRIPAVVRRPSSELGGGSLLDLVAEGRAREVLDGCRRMFRFADAHG